MAPLCLINSFVALGLKALILTPLPLIFLWFLLRFCSIDEKHISYQPVHGSCPGRLSSLLHVGDVPAPATSEAWAGSQHDIDLTQQNRAHATSSTSSLELVTDITFIWSLSVTPAFVTGTINNRRTTAPWVYENLSQHPRNHRLMECTQYHGALIYTHLDWGPVVLNLHRNTFAIALEFLKHYRRCYCFCGNSIQTSRATSFSGAIRRVCRPKCILPLPTSGKGKKRDSPYTI